MANMTVVDPRRDMLTLRDAMDKLFEDSFVRPWGRLANGSAERSLTVDMLENENQIVVKAAVPGIKPEDLDISVSGDVLTIKGETRQDDEVNEANYHYREWRYGSFERSLSLPAGVNADAASAEVKDGVLTLTLPKSEQARVKKLTIKGS